MVQREVLYRILRRRQHLGDLARPLVPRAGPPEVVDPQESALEQVLAQPLRLYRPQAHRPDVRRHQERTTEHRVVRHSHHPVVGIADLVQVDVRGGHLRQPDHEVDVGERIVGRPAATRTLAPVARVHQPTEGEPFIDVIGWPKAGRVPGAAVAPLRERDRRQGGHRQHRQHDRHHRTTGHAVLPSRSRCQGAAGSATCRPHCVTSGPVRSLRRYNQSPVNQSD